MAKSFFIVFVASAMAAVAGQSGIPTTPSAAARMSEAGPEQRALMRDVGRWDVVSSIWPAPGAKPIVTRGIIAERTMIGAFLQETMLPAPGSRTPDFSRLDYLNFDRVEGRWKYVSMDTRFPVSIMPASGFIPARDGTIRLLFASQAFVGFGQNVEGRFMLSDMTIKHLDADHMTKEQHIIMADGTGRSWLLTRYEYIRRR